MERNRFTILQKKFVEFFTEGLSETIISYVNVRPEDEDGERFEKRVEIIAPQILQDDYNPVIEGNIKTLSLNSETSDGFVFVSDDYTFTYSQEVVQTAEGKHEEINYTISREINDSEKPVKVNAFKDWQNISVEYDGEDASKKMLVKLNNKSFHLDEEISIEPEDSPYILLVKLTEQYGTFSNLLNEILVQNKYDEISKIADIFIYDSYEVVTTRPYFSYFSGRSYKPNIEESFIDEVTGLELIQMFPEGTGKLSWVTYVNQWQYLEYCRDQKNSNYPPFSQSFCQTCGVLSNFITASPYGLTKSELISQSINMIAAGQSNADFIELTIQCLCDTPRS